MRYKYVHTKIWGSEGAITDLSVDIYTDISATALESAFMSWVSRNAGFRQDSKMREPFTWSRDLK